MKLTKQTVYIPVKIEDDSGNYIPDKSLLLVKEQGEADNKNYRDYSFYAPTIAEVIMWLYEKHEIFIQPFTIGEEGKMKFYIKLIVNDNGWIKIKHQISTIYNSPTKAYEAAIEYTLNNLI